MSTRTILGFAAASLLTAASALASDYRIVRAKIPFEFRAGAASAMPAGEYEIEAPHGRGVPMFVVRNLNTGKAAAFMAPISVAASNDRTPDLVKLDFLCAGTECAL